MHNRDMYSVIIMRTGHIHEVYWTFVKRSLRILVAGDGGKSRGLKMLWRIFPIHLFAFHLNTVKAP